MPYIPNGKEMYMHMCVCVHICIFIYTLYLLNAFSYFVMPMYLWIAFHIFSLEFMAFYCLHFNYNVHIFDAQIVRI